MDVEIVGDCRNNDILGQGRENIYSFDYIADAIVILIPQVAKLCGIYQAWYPLREEEREALDKKAINNFTNDYLALYKVFIEALQRWDNIQDVQGASGAEQGLVMFEYQLERQLLAIASSVESFLESMDRTRQLRERPYPTQRVCPDPCHCRHKRKQTQLQSVQSLADFLSGSDLPEPLSD